MSKSKSEKSQIYCSFFNNVGSCMHGEACSKIHVRPNISKTILLSNLYPNPLKFISMLPENALIIEPDTLTRNFDEFYFDIYEELRMYGPIEDLLVAGNLCDHLVGNVLVRFVDELDAVNALEDLQNRFYAGRPIDAQFSPVENLQESTCKQYFTNECKHGENCNFIHPMYPSDYVLKECQLAQEKTINYPLKISSVNEKEFGDERRRSKLRDRNYEFEKDRKREKHDSRRSRDDSPPRDRSYDRKYRSDSQSRDRNEKSYRSDRDDRNYRSERSYRSNDRDDRNERDRGSRDRNDERDRNYRNERDRDRGNRDRNDEKERSYGRDKNDEKERNYGRDRDKGGKDRNERSYKGEKDRNSDRNDRDKGNRNRNDRDSDDDNDWGKSSMRDYDRDRDGSFNVSSTTGYTRTRVMHRNHF